MRDVGGPTSCGDERKIAPSAEHCGTQTSPASGQAGPSGVHEVPLTEQEPFDTPPAPDEAQRTLNFE